MINILQVSSIDYGDDNYVHAKDLFALPDVQGIVVRIYADEEPIFVTQSSSIFAQNVGLRPVQVLVCMHNGCQIKIIYGQLFGMPLINDNWDINTTWLSSKLDEKLLNIKLNTKESD